MTSGRIAIHQLFLASRSSFSERAIVHTVFILALPDTIAFDLATPIEVLGRVRLPGDRPGYRIQICGIEPFIEAGPLHLAVDHGLDALAHAETIVVPGRNDPAVPVPDAALNALRSSAATGTRIASISVGAFTHAAAGLHLVRRDYGAAIAADASRLAVAPLHRDGGQAQYISRPNAHPAETGLATVLEWIETHAHEDLTLTVIAAHAGLSARTLNRRFHEQPGQTPIQWVTAVRIRRAQELLQTTDLGVDHIAHLVGFASPAHFRIQFKRLSGVAPHAYRATFRTAPRAKKNTSDKATPRSVTI